MSESRKIAAILVADVVGYSRLAGADEDRTLSRLRGLRSDLIDPAIAAHHGRIVKRTGDGSLIEFRSVVDAVRCAIEVQNGLVERNAGLPPERRIEFRVGIHLGDVVEEARRRSDGRRRQHRRAARGHRRARRDLSLRGRLSAGQGAARSRGHRSRPDPTQEHRRADPGLFARSRRARRGEARADPAPEKSAPPRLSMVVLPFANIGGDPEQEHFVDGVTESLTTDLSRIRGAVVIARNTAFTYKGKPLDVKTIGRELNVRYVLEGSVQRGGNRMRVNVQLIDAETGNHLWAERFDKPLADLFDMQDEIVARLASALNAQLVAAEARRAEQAPNPDSMDLYFQGLAWLNKGLTPDNLAQARSFFDRALDRRSRQCRRARWIGGPPTRARRKFLCDRSHRGLRGGRSETDQSLVLGPGPCARPYVLGTCRHVDQARRGRASPNANMRWRWIEISPTPMPLSDLVRLLSVAPKKRGSHC